MNKSKHIIRQSRLEIKLSKRDRALQQQEQVAALFRQNLPLALDEVLSPLAGSHQLFQIDTLEIDLGTIKLEDEQAIRDQLVRQLKLKLSEISLEKRKEGADLLSAGHTFLYFLEWGHFPWNGRVSRLSELEEEIKNLSIINVTTTITSTETAHRATKVYHDLKEKAIHLFNYKHTVRQRLVLQFSSSFFMWFLVELFGNESVEKHTIELLGDTGVDKGGEALHTFRPASDFKGKALNKKHKIQLLNLLLNKEVQHEGDKTLSPKKGYPTNDNSNISVTKDQQQDHAPQEEEGMFVSNAGIILLHPFLKRFFNQLGLLEGNSFLDRSMQERAIHLLNFLATGEETLEEQDSSIYKTLCGIEINAPIEREVTLRDSEKGESLTVLNTAIQQWSKLKNTSPDNLRATFLQRNGIIKRKNKDWHLTIEQQAFDLLLDYLPWQIAIIKLPWMTQKLWVEWA